MSQNCDSNYPGLIAPASLKRALADGLYDGRLGLSGAYSPGLIEAGLLLRMGRYPPPAYPGLIAPASLKRSGGACGLGTFGIIRGL